MIFQNMAPKTKKELMAQYRQRLKDDKEKYEEALQRDRERQRIAYQRKKISLGQKKKEELMERNCQKQ